MFEKKQYKIIEREERHSCYEGREVKRYNVLEGQQIWLKEQDTECERRALKCSSKLGRNENFGKESNCLAGQRKW